MTIVYERINQAGFLFTETSVAVAVLTAEYGDGYGAGATIGNPAGLRTWNLKIDALPDNDQYLVNANARGSVTLVSQPNNNDTIVIGGKTYTWKTSSPTGDQILIGSDAIASALNLAAKVNADKSSTLCTAEASGAAVEFMANTAGVGGNSVALTTDGTRLTKVAFANGQQTRANYLWDFFLRSKAKGNRPFWLEDPKSPHQLYFAEFVDNALTYPVLCSLVYSTGASLRQRRVAGIESPIDSGPPAAPTDLVVTQT
jgi:hypothetical protein